MRTSVAINSTVLNRRMSIAEAADLAAEYERFGVDLVWSAESWGTDALTPLAYLAAKTERVILATGIVQLAARSAAMTAMSAMTLDELSGGRFALGLGVSGPRIVEGVHGQPYTAPLARLREYVEVVRMALAGKRLDYRGSHLTIPVPGFEGRAMRLGREPTRHVPIYLATLGPKAMELCGELAEGWVGLCFVPELSAVYTDPLFAGARRAGRDPGSIDVTAGGPVAFTADAEPFLVEHKKTIAFQMCALGSRTVNFYRDAYRRLGYADAVDAARAAWFKGDRAGAADAVPDELASRTSMVGTDDEVRARVRAYRDAGVTTMRLEPQGRTRTEHLNTVARAVEMVREVSAEKCRAPSARPAVPVAGSDHAVGPQPG